MISVKRSIFKGQKNYFLPEAKITYDHGKIFRFDGFLLYPIYHPAAALRSTQMKEEFLSWTQQKYM